MKYKIATASAPRADTNGALAPAVYSAVGTNLIGGQCSMAPSPAATSSSAGIVGKSAQRSGISGAHRPFLLLGSFSSLGFNFLHFLLST